MAHALGLTVSLQDVSKSTRSGARWQQRPGAGPSRRPVQVDAVSSSVDVAHSAPSTPRSLSPSRGNRASNAQPFWGSTSAFKSRMNGLWQAIVARVGQYAPAGVTATGVAEAVVLDQASAGMPALQHSSPVKQQLHTRAYQPAARKPLLQPFLNAADTDEVHYASLLSDLCNMAYDVPSNVNEEALADRHGLVFASASNSVFFGPITRATWEAQVQAARSARSNSQVKLESTIQQPSTPAETVLVAHRVSSISSTADQSDLIEDGASDAEEEGDIAAATGAAIVAAVDDLTASLAASAASPEQDVQQVTQHTVLSLTIGSPSISPAVSCHALSALDAESPTSAHSGFGYPGLLAADAVSSLTMSTATYCEDSDGLDDDLSPSLHNLRVRRRLFSQLELEPSSWPPHVTAAGPAPAAPAAAAAEPCTSQPPSPSSPITTAKAPFSNSAPAAPDTMPPQHVVMEPGLASPQAAKLTSDPEPPSAWFACDDPATNTRYFVIQGSTTFLHWQINLQFEPVIFEDPALGVHVHRGVYQAALQLYDDLLPLVRQHLRTCPNASISFTGHSLGGSLATVLMLLFVYRGVLPVANLAPTYTYGAPAVFCGGAPADGPAARCATCQGGCSALATAPLHVGCTRPRGLLSQLGLKEDHLVNVVMHKDIVPRAFVCDYTVVADLLKKWMPSLKDYSTLSASQEHKSLYNFIGRMAVLRPDNGSHFVQGDAHHPMLPDAGGLYKLYEPVAGLSIFSMSGSFDELETIEAPPGRPTLRSAILQFMNFPHPLTMLSDYGSYGPNGAISRYHNPDNYTKGLERLAALSMARSTLGHIRLM